MNSEDKAKIIIRIKYKQKVTYGNKGKKIQN